MRPRGATEPVEVRQLKGGAGLFTYGFCQVRSSQFLTQEHYGLVLFLAFAWYPCRNKQVYQFLQIPTAGTGRQTYQSGSSFLSLVTIYILIHKGRNVRGIIFTSNSCKKRTVIFFNFVKKFTICINKSQWQEIGKRREIGKG